MLSILCPHCATQLSVERKWQGRTINCLSCGKQMAVPTTKAAPNVPQNDSPLVVQSSPRAVQRRRKRPLGNRILSTALHLCITGVTVYAGYYLIIQRNADKPAEAVAIASSTSPAEVPSPLPARRREDSSREVVVAAPSKPSPDTPAPDEEPHVVVSPFEGMARLLELPSSDDRTITTLRSTVDDIVMQLLTNTAELSHRAGSLEWRSREGDSATKVAELSLSGRSLNFRWQASVPVEAEAAIRNSVVRLRRGDFEHFVRLRSPRSTRPLQVDLGKAQQKIVSKSEFLPPTQEIVFELLDLDNLPAFTIEGSDTGRLQLRDQLTLRYLEVDTATTNLTMKKRGPLVVVEIEHRFALPSGDQQPMTITNGDNQRKSLIAAQEEIAAAERALLDLRTRVKELEKQAKSVQSARTSALAKSAQLDRLQSEAAAVRQQIGYAERIAIRKQAVAVEFQALQQVAELAQQLHDAKLAYRFFTVVEGQEVDILIAR